MSSEEKIRKLFAKSGLTVNSKIDDRIINDVLTELDKSEKTQSVSSEPNIWRIIMKSKITKLAAAAMIIVAIIIGFNQFRGSIDLATIAFADISEAMKNAPWMHNINWGGFESLEKGIVNELWIGFKTKIQAEKWSDGTVHFCNIKEHKKYEYDPENNSITIYVLEDDLPSYILFSWSDLSSPVSFLEYVVKMLKEKNEIEIITKETEYNGQIVQLQEIFPLQRTNKWGESYIIRLYIQPDTKLLLAFQVKGTDSNGNTIMDGEITYSYPQTGPADIYDLGVPRDAKIINKLPTEVYQAQ